MKYICYSFNLFLFLLISMNSFSQSYQSNYVEDILFGVGLGLSAPKSIDNTGVYKNIAIEGNIQFQKFIFNASIGLGWNVGENKYGSGGLSNKHSTTGVNAGYIFPYKRIGIAPLIGVCYDQTYYNDRYYDNSIGETENYFDYGAMFMYTYKNTMFSLKFTKYFPIGLSAYLLLY